MTTLLPETETGSVPPAPEAPKLPDASSLQDRMPDWFKTPPLLAGFALVLGIVFCVFSYWPLWHTDVWGHLAYGRLMWETRGLPETEPLLPLAEGMPYVATAWLSQLVGYAMHRGFGVPGIQFLYGASITLCLGLLLWRLYERTANVWLGLGGGAVFLWVNWQQLIIVRPQLAGLACFVALLVMLTGRRWSRAYWVIVPVMFALWANLHGSFPVGLALLGCFLVGRACDILRRTDKFAAIAADRQVRRYFLLLELAAVAVLLNPYGLALYAEALAFSNNPNLRDLVEWEPLTLRMRQGQAAAMTALALIAAYRLSPRRVSAAEVLLLVGLGAGMLWTSRLIVWWAPVAALYLTLHAGAAYRKMSKSAKPRPAPEPSSRRSTWTVVAIGIVWIAFAYTPFGITLLHGRDESLDRAVSQSTPVRAVDYLTRNPPQGQVFNTFEWGDYLLWAGPEGIEVFVNSHVHLMPEDIWRDYITLIRGHAGWPEMLDRYGVNTIVVDKGPRLPLVRSLKQNENWYVGYEDSLSAVIVRREPIP